LTATYGGRLAVGGKIRQDELDRVLFFFPQIAQAIMSVGDTTRRYRGAVRAATRIMEVLDSRPSISAGPHRLPTDTVRGEIVFDDVSFGYDPAVPVLERISLVLPPGATLAIVGPTGSGKSTLLRLLLRYYDVGKGRILLDGRDIREIDLEDLRRAIGLVSQDSYLFDGSVRDNVLFAAPDAPAASLRAALHDAQALTFVNGLPGGLDAEIGEAGRRLSSGERQRLSIARALVKRAPILALDEVTSHLDYATERAIRTSMRAASRQRTTLVVAHRLSTIRDTDEIIVLDRGRIRERGRHDDLVAARGLYATLWQLQSQVEQA
jgi:ATP-binding cassette subfamily B protein